MKLLSFRKSKLSSKAALPITAVTISLAVVLPLIFSSSERDIGLEDSPILAEIKHKLDLNTFIYNLPVSQQPKIDSGTIQALANIDNADIDNVLILYMISQHRFAYESERKVFKDLLDLLPNADRDNIAYLDCLLAESCQYDNLISTYKASPWLTYWIQKSDESKLKMISNELNSLNTRALYSIKYFKHRSKSGNHSIVPPAIADYVVTIPFYENCENNKANLISYLREAQLSIPELTGIASYYESHASKGDCNS